MPNSCSIIIYITYISHADRARCIARPGTGRALAHAVNMGVDLSNYTELSNN